MRLKLVFGLLAALSAHGIAAHSVDLCGETPSANEIRIGILYRSGSLEGKRMLDSVLDTLSRRESDKGEAAKQDGRPVSETRICIKPYPYPTEERGYRKLKEIRDDLQVDLVIGPTDSGVWRDALREAEAFANKQLLVISPVVAATFKEESDWLFKTNVDVGARAEPMVNFLKRRAVDSIGVLYEGTEFGLSAEEALREASRGLGWYQAARYDDNSDLARAVDVLLEARPAAIGILSSRQKARGIHETIKARSHGLNPYRPYLFCIIDVRSLEIEELDFVSIGTKAADETSVVTDKTMLQLLDVLDQVPGTRRTSPEAWALNVKDGLAGVLELSSTRKGRLFSWQDGTVVSLAPTDDRSILDLAMQHPKVLYRRYGFLPAFNLAIVIVLVILLTKRDLRKWNDERDLDRTTRMAMAKVVTFNVVIALIVFLFMILTGLTDWTSSAGAIVVGFGYPALLKSTLGQTKTGRSIGLSELYDDYLRNLNDTIMLTKYHHRKAIVDFIAMTNSVSRMREALLTLYGYNSPARKRELTEGLEAELQTAKDSLERRTIYARRIYRTHALTDLITNNFVPPIEQEEIIGPEEILQAAVEYCRRSSAISLASLRKDFEARLQSRAEDHPESAAEDKKEVEECLRYAQTEAGDMRCYLRWLLTQEGFMIPKIIDLGYLPNGVSTWTREEWNPYARRASEARRVEWPGQDEVSSETPEATDETR